jgi:hypothetical protein
MSLDLRGGRANINVDNTSPAVQTYHYIPCCCPFCVCCQDPSLWPAAVDEICRYHTASSYALRRVAIEDVKLKDTTIK